MSLLTPITLTKAPIDRLGYTGSIGRIMVTGIRHKDLLVLGLLLVAVVVDCGEQDQ